MDIDYDLTQIECLKAQPAPGQKTVPSDELIGDIVMKLQQYAIFSVKNINNKLEKARETLEALGFDDISNYCPIRARAENLAVWEQTPEDDQFRVMPPDHSILNEILTRAKDCSDKYITADDGKLIVTDDYTLSEVQAMLETLGLERRYRVHPADTDEGKPRHIVDLQAGIDASLAEHKHAVGQIDARMFKHIVEIILNHIGIPDGIHVNIGEDNGVSVTLPRAVDISRIIRLLKAHNIDVAPTDIHGEDYVLRLRFEKADMDWR